MAFLFIFLNLRFCIYKYFSLNDIYNIRLQQLKQAG
jgi:hypothetical protein